MIAISVIAGLFGLLIGSFLNVVVYRVPAGKSIVAPPSACPHCEHRIRWYDNIPVVSWLVLRGKCRDCKAPISVRYPLVEFATGLFFFVVTLRFSGPILDARSVAATVAAMLVAVAFLYLCAISVALALIDIDTHKLPNVIVLPAYAVAAVLLTSASIITGDYAGLLRAGIAMAALAVIYFVIAIVYPGGMGFGDVKLAGVLGAFLGWSSWGAVIVGSFAPFLLGGIFGVVLIVLKRASRKSGIPFGPWMLAGAWIGVFFGDRIWGGYLSLFGLTT